MLAGFQNGFRDRKVRLRDRQIDNDVNFRIGEQRIDALRRDVEFGAPCFRRRRIDVGTSGDPNAPEQGASLK